MVVRINALSTGFAADDIREIAEAQPDEIVIPKVKSPDDIKIVESILDAAESNSQPDNKIGLQALIETASGVEAVHEIANASKRLTVLQFGRADYFADIGANKSCSMEEIRFAKKLLAAYEKSQMVGVGVIVVDDKLVDKAAVVSANKLRHMAERLGLWGNG